MIQRRRSQDSGINLWLGSALMLAGIVAVFWMPGEGEHNHTLHQSIAAAMIAFGVGFLRPDLLKQVLHALLKIIPWTDPDPSGGDT